jgi:hypothetical protein
MTTEVCDTTARRAIKCNGYLTHQRGGFNQFWSGPWLDEGYTKVILRLYKVIHGYTRLYWRPFCFVRLSRTKSQGYTRLYRVIQGYTNDNSEKNKVILRLY